MKMSILDNNLTPPLRRKITPHPSPTKEDGWRGSMLRACDPVHQNQANVAKDVIGEI